MTYLISHQQNSEIRNSGKCRPLVRNATGGPRIARIVDARRCEDTVTGREDTAQAAQAALQLKVDKEVDKFP